MSCPSFTSLFSTVLFCVRTRTKRVLSDSDTSRDDMTCRQKVKGGNQHRTKEGSSYKISDTIPQDWLSFKGDNKKPQLF